MGYETRLYIGQVMDRSKHEDAQYFLKMGMIDLCKCGHEGAFPNLISHATTSKETDKNKSFPLVYWSESNRIEREKALKTFKEKNQALADSLGENLETIFNEICETAEDWEHEVRNDSYGSKLRAVPIMEVYEAMKKSNAESLIEDGQTYRRYDIALATLKEFIDAFSYIEKNETKCKLYCVLYGY